MKSTGGATYRPFEDLKTLLKERPFSPESGKGTKPKESAEQQTEGAEDEHLLFLEAMKGVEPVMKEHIIVSDEESPPPRLSGKDDDADAMTRLRELIRCGDGFVVSYTSEYMEGLGYGVRPEVARRLHRGDFSIQGHIDLHGYPVKEAKQVFETFLKESIEARLRAVLIIHGRGRSSRDKPVLKGKVKKWLTRGPWRKWVIAFTSARPCDGGAGATYVLLRHRPATKRHRKIYGVVLS